MVSHRKNGLGSLFKEVTRVFKEYPPPALSCLEAEIVLGGALLERGTLPLGQNYYMPFFYVLGNYFQKNPRAHKNKIGTPPPKTQNTPPPQNEEFYGHRFSCRKNAFFPGVHKIGAAISGPRIADTNFTDTRIFLIFSPEHRKLTN